MLETLEAAILAALFGLIAGSFVNVVIHRLPREGMSVVRPRSHCPACGHTLSWYENIPLASWVALRGRCRACGVRIPVRYPLVEASTGALFFASFASAGAGPGDLAFAGLRAAVLAALVAVSFIDFEHRIIPDEISIPGMVLAPVASLFFPRLQASGVLFGELLGRTGSRAGSALLLSLGGLLAGAGLVYGVGVLGKAVFRKEAMGMGDVKLMGMLGGLLGPEGVFLAFLIGVVSGAVFGIAWFLGTGDRYIPFGPFLALGGAALLLAGEAIREFFLVTYPAWLRELLGR